LFYVKEELPMRVPRGRKKIFKDFGGHATVTVRNSEPLIGDFLHNVVEDDNFAHLQRYEVGLAHTPP